MKSHKISWVEKLILFLKKLNYEKMDNIYSIIIKTSIKIEKVNYMYSEEVLNKFKN